MKKIAQLKNTMLKTSVSCILVLAFMTACTSTDMGEETVKNLTPNIDNSIVQDKVYAQLKTESYKYWTQHKINASTDMFWDMAANTGRGCGIDGYTYNTQIVPPQEVGYEQGYPTEKLVETMMTERQVMFTMCGYELGEWQTDSDGNAQCYDTFVSEVYQTTDKTGRTWDFFLYDYTLKTKEDTEGTHSFNLFGVTPYYDEWLTIELTGTLPVKNTDTAQLNEIMEIYSEFAEIYGFTGLFTGRTSNEATAHYLIGF